jgi:hypothetical protein
VTEKNKETCIRPMLPIFVFLTCDKSIRNREHRSQRTVNRLVSEGQMPDIQRFSNHGSAVEQTEQRPIAGHGIPDIARRQRPGRGNWSRIFGLIHALGSDEDDSGPISPIRY